MNIDPKHISHIETGRSFPKADLIEKFAIALEVDYTEFFKTKHLKPKAALIKEIAKLLENADNDSVKTIYKLVAGYFD